MSKKKPTDTSRSHIDPAIGYTVEEAAKLLGKSEKGIRMLLQGVHPLFDKYGRRLSRHSLWWRNHKGTRGGTIRLISGASMLTFLRNQVILRATLDEERRVLTRSAA